MKVRIQMDVVGNHVDETLNGANAEEILAQAKSQVAKKLGWKGLFLNAMSPLTFAQRAVELYNSNHNTTYALPQSADEFLKLGQDLGYLTVIPDAS